MSYKKHEMLILREHLSSPLYIGVNRGDHFLVFRVELYFDFIRPVSCVLNVSIVSGLYIIDCLLRFSLDIYG